MYIVLIANEDSKSIISEKYYSKINDAIDAYRLCLDISPYMIESELDKYFYSWARFRNNNQVILFELSNLDLLKITYAQDYINMFRTKYNRLNNTKYILS